MYLHGGAYFVQALVLDCGLWSEARWNEWPAGKCYTQWCARSQIPYTYYIYIYVSMKLFSRRTYQHAEGQLNLLNDGGWRFRRGWSQSSRERMIVSSRVMLILITQDWFKLVEVQHCGQKASFRVVRGSSYFYLLYVNQIIVFVLFGGWINDVGAGGRKKRYRLARVQVVVMCDIL